LAQVPNGPHDSFEKAATTLAAFSVSAGKLIDLSVRDHICTRVRRGFLLGDFQENG